MWMTFAVNNIVMERLSVVYLSASSDCVSCHCSAFFLVSGAATAGHESTTVVLPPQAPNQPDRMAVADRNGKDQVTEVFKSLGATLLDVGIHRAHLVISSHASFAYGPLQGCSALAPCTDQRSIVVPSCAVVYDIAEWAHEYDST
ncbi:hypothetical protein BS78_09G203900 [Paspalum vaginatum]|nr:hypothetical protein BS78_09G203900 [Paspalum vaginatum]